MKIRFFEEYPVKKNLDKLRLLGFRTDLFIASPSLKEFKQASQNIRKEYKNVDKVIYWPILADKEGYWLSPFSEKGALKRLIAELNSEKAQLDILWDAEFPTLRKRLYLTELFHFFNNKKQIISFLANTKHNIWSAEYGYDNSFTEFMLRFFGVAFDPKKIPHKKILMLYTSFIKNSNVKDYLLHHLSHSLNKGREINVGLGTIARGAAGNELILSPKALYHDLSVLQQENIKEAVIYRLGGLNKDYVKVLNKFI